MPDPYTKFSSIKPMNHEDLILRDLMETSDEIYDIPEMQDEKFAVFCEVCDNLLKEGRISAIQHERWTNIF